jgi:hypothetical protein
VAGGLSPAAVPLLLAAGGVYAGFFASLGLWCSVTSRSTLRATLVTLLATLAVIAGPGHLVRAVLGRPNRPGQPVSWESLVTDYALNPPAALKAVTFRAKDLEQGDGIVVLGRILAAGAGLHGYLIAAAVLWLAARARLQAAQGPAPRREGDRLR